MSAERFASISGQILTFTAPIQLTSGMSQVAATFIQSLDVTGKWTGMIDLETG